MNDKLANDLIRYAELVEDSALISPEEMNCASVMRLAAEYLAQPAVTESHKQEPVAWINWCAATGKQSVSFECESELASQPLYTKEQL